MWVDFDWLTVDFASDEAIYVQLHNKIIEAIAAERLVEGNSLPSVRQLADNVGINMHTVNKVYAILKQEGYITLDRRNGAVITLDIDKLKAAQQLRADMRKIVARAVCSQLNSDEIHKIVDDVIGEFN
ncbi:MAG: GntR family transcriptional regulator [Eubacteriales bacterium]|nr:GntR family transcriptional regulator [Eubacteriales bacterium]